MAVKMNGETAESCRNLPKNVPIINEMFRSTDLSSQVPFPSHSTSPFLSSGHWLDDSRNKAFKGKQNIRSATRCL